MYEVWFSCLGNSTQTALLNRVEFKAFRLINSPNSPTLTDCLDSLSHRRNVASLCFFYRYCNIDCSSKLNCMAPPLSRPGCTRISTFFIAILSIFLMQKLTSIFTFSSLTLINSGTLFLCLFFHLPMT